MNPGIPSPPHRVVWDGENSPPQVTKGDPRPVGKKGKQGRGKRSVVGGKSGGVPMMQRAADTKWLESGGLTRPHTSAGIAAAKRLITVNSLHRDALRRYLMTSPVEPAPSSAKPSKQVPLGPDGWPLSTSVRTVGGGLPGLGKRQ